MCGIIGCTGSTDAVTEILNGLQNLEYRGYDSAGIAVRNDSGLTLHKREGELAGLKRDLAGTSIDASAGIGHTRWSTHGPPTDENAHPHTGETGDVAVVHNGIIENYDQLRDELEADGRIFTSETDTEVVPHLVERYLADGADAETAFYRTMARLEGSYAIAMMVDGSDAIYATRQDSPLVVGVDEGTYYLASDVPAFLEFTDRVVYLQDGDYVVATPSDMSITDADGNPVDREIDRVEWDPGEATKGSYDHFMRKEIDSQPNALSNTISGRIKSDRSGVDLDELQEREYVEIDDVHLVACGTSYHAALYGARLFTQAGIRAHAIRASEYGARMAGESTLVVAVTQSGETADTLAALRSAKATDARTLAVTNVVGSSAARDCDEALQIRAGPEIGVAATKTFTSQVVALSMLVEHMTDQHADVPNRADAQAFYESLAALPDQVHEVLGSSRAMDIARTQLHRSAYFFIGSGLLHPVALEGALKFKEITYEHAEGFAAGELKHGPLALVTHETTVFTLFGGVDDERTKGNAKEVQARGAEIVAVAPYGLDVSDVADDCLRIPTTHPALAGLLGNIQLQLVSYHVADQLDRSIDKPRNLAKSVTVQ